MTAIKDHDKRIGLCRLRALHFERRRPGEVRADVERSRLRRNLKTMRKGEKIGNVILGKGHLDVGACSRRYGRSSFRRRALSLEMKRIQ